MAFGSLHMPRYKPWHGEADPQNVLFVSVHGYGPRERGLEHLMPQAAFYPGTGKTVLPDIPGAAVPAVPSSGSAPVEVPMQRDEEEEEEEEDDGDFDRDEDEDEDDDYSVDEYTPAAQGSGGRLDEMRHMYEFRGDSGLSLSRMPPLILDIGVGLPAGDDAVSALLYTGPFINSRASPTNIIVSFGRCRRVACIVTSGATTSGRRYSLA